MGGWGGVCYRIVVGAEHSRGNPVRSPVGTRCITLTRQNACLRGSYKWQQTGHIQNNSISISETNTRWHAFMYVYLLLNQKHLH